MDSVFISQDNYNNSDISGKITYTNIIETIPEGSVNHDKKDWKKTFYREWRWRFLELPNRRFTVEISYMDHNATDRIFFNKHGKWVPRDIDPIYDRYVIKQYFYYT